MLKTKLISLILIVGVIFPMCSFGTVNADDDITVYLASDSTVAYWEPKYAPQAGWGMLLPKYFKSEVTVENRAISGLSSKTYIVDGHLDKILAEIEQGDYLFIQFGHNDATPSRPQRYTEPYTTFKEYLYQYIDGARDKDAIPVLITPVARRVFNEATGLFTNTFEDYCAAMEQVAEEKEVGILDLASRSRKYLETIGIDATKSIFLYVEPGESEGEYYKGGKEDTTHFQEYGADQMAKLLIEELLESDIELKNYVTDDRSGAVPMIKSFADMKAHWARNAAEELAAIGVVNGVDDSQFMPEKTITRAEFIALVSRAIDLEETEYQNSFVDVTTEQWYAKIVQAAYEQSLIMTEMMKDKNLDADKPINREEMAAIIMNAYKMKTKDKTVDESQASDETANPKYYDMDQISDWAQESVTELSRLGIIKGISETEFAPKDNSTRAQAAVIIKSLMEKL